MFFQSVAVDIDCNGSAVIHQTFDDCGCSLRMSGPHHYEKAARYARAAWLRKSAPGAEKLGISYPGVPDFFVMIVLAEFKKQRA